MANSSEIDLEKKFLLRPDQKSPNITLPVAKKKKVRSNTELEDSDKQLQILPMSLDLYKICTRSRILLVWHTNLSSYSCILIFSCETSRQ